METLAQGAESSILIVDKKILKKIRHKKEYRNSELDLKLRKFRCKREFKILKRLEELEVNVPKPYEIELKNTSFTFEYLKGDVLKNVLTKENLKQGFLEICKLHNTGIVHGDLTTLNMMLIDSKVYIIDFGLSNFSEHIEERSVDLNLFFHCIENEHRKFYSMKEELLKTYSKEVENGEKVIKRLEEVEKRGRNKNK